MALLSKALFSSWKRLSPSCGSAKTCPAVRLSEGIAPPPSPQARELVANDLVRKCLRFIVVSPQFQPCTFRFIGYVNSFRPVLTPRIWRMPECTPISFVLERSFKSRCQVPGVRCQGRKNRFQAPGVRCWASEERACSAGPAVRPCGSSSDASSCRVANRTIRFRLGHAPNTVSENVQAAPSKPRRGGKAHL